MPEFISWGILGSLNIIPQEGQRWGGQHKEAGALHW